MPALVDSWPDAEEPGRINYTLTSLRSADDVQVAIFNIMDNVVNGEVTFDHPRRSYSVLDGLTAWRSRGYVRSFEHA